MAGIERIKIKQLSKYLEQDFCRSEALSYLADDVYRKVFHLIDNDVDNIEVDIDDKKARYDLIEGIDLILTLKDGSRLTMQEKILNTDFNTATFETKKASGKDGAWCTCTANYYFVGYVSRSNMNEFKRWVIIDFARIKVLHNEIALKFNYKKRMDRSIDGGEHFKYISFNDIPKECIIGIYDPKCTEPFLPF